MRKAGVLLTIAVLLVAVLRVLAAGALSIFVIDVEGGQATLIVAPTGESMLVDAGWAGFNGRDADRIAAAAKQAGVTKLDYLLVTHYHADHVGGVPAVASRLPVKTFVDHGPTVEEGERPAQLYSSYETARRAGQHLEVKPGDSFSVGAVAVRVVSAGGSLIGAPIPGAGTANPLCSSFTPIEEDKTENARSVGVVLTFGRFRMLDLGDLTWNKEHDLVCPNNRVGTVDLYLTSHHGLNISGAPFLVHAVRPRVAIMNNGAKKGGTPQAWQTVHTTPGLEAFWQLHYAVDAGADHNVSEPFIANTDDTTGYGIRVSATDDGGFTVTNDRTGKTVQYPARK